MGRRSLDEEVLVRLSRFETGNLATLVQEEKAPAQMEVRSRRGAAKRGRSKTIGREDVLRPSMALHS